jgi:hypothetical protein
LRTAKTANHHAVIRQKLESLNIRQCLDDSDGRDIYDLANRGDWYVLSKDDTIGIGYIYELPARRNAGIMCHNLPPEYIKRACKHAFDNYAYKKIKAETPYPDAFLDAGFEWTGISFDDGLFQGKWVHIIALELRNPEWSISEDGLRWSKGDNGWLQRFFRWLTAVAIRAKLWPNVANAIRAEDRAAIRNGDGTG